ncbi:MAG: DUF2203 domain-containing protein [SAR202 cluster bacterium]|nr:DUF2203 domain-containing protein [SAR202 cluster bacterium]
MRTVLGRDGYQLEEHMTEREFTLEEARELVPWLVATFRTLDLPRSRAKQLDAAIKEYSGSVNGNANGSSNSQGQLERLQRALREVSAEIETAVSDILDQGILVKGVEPGLVDFPHDRDGRQVYLCWREGESGIEFWHDVEVGFAGRRPL